jgi:hypothetical protein
MVMTPLQGCFLFGRPDAKHPRFCARGRVQENMRHRLHKTPPGVAGFETAALDLDAW